MLSQPPINVHGTPGRYASALFSAASKAKALPTAQKELKEVGRDAVEIQQSRALSYLDSFHTESGFMEW